MACSALTSASLPRAIVVCSFALVSRAATASASLFLYCSRAALALFDNSPSNRAGYPQMLPFAAGVAVAEGVARGATCKTSGRGGSACSSCQGDILRPNHPPSSLILAAN